MWYISDDFLIGLLLFLLIFLVSWLAIKKFFKDENISRVIAITISLLAVYYMTFEQKDFISIFYSTWGSLILISIPLAISIFFIFSLNIGTVMRRILWFFLFGLALVLSENLNLNQEISEKFFTGIIILAIIIIVFDKSIKNKLNFNKNIKK